MASLYAHPFRLPDAFEDRSIHIFYLRDGEGGASAALGRPDDADPAFEVMLAHLRPGLAPPGHPARFQPNMVVTRVPTCEGLAELLAEQRRQLSRTPVLVVKREGPFRVAGLTAHEVEITASLETPRLDIVQWQVFTLRDGYACSFFATTTAARFERDKPQFEALIAGWT